MMHILLGIQYRHLFFWKAFQQQAMGFFFAHSTADDFHESLSSLPRIHHNVSLLILEKLQQQLGII